MKDQAADAPHLIVLHLPWGLFGPSRNRQELRAPGKVESRGQVAPLLFTRDDRPVRIDGRDRNSALFVDLRTRNHEAQRIWEIPVPLDDRKTQTLRFPGWDGDVLIERRHRVRRPPTGATHTQEDDDTDIRGMQLLHFVQMIAVRM